MKFRFLKSRLLASGLAFGVICGACSPVVFADITYVTGTVGHVEHKLPALHQAAEAGDLSEVKRLLASGAAIDGIADSDFYYANTPLIWAIGHGQTIIAKYLVDQGANVNKPNRNGSTPLLFAVKGDDADMVGYLLDHGARLDYKDNDGFTLLCYAIIRASNYNYEGGFAVLKCLVERGADVNLPGHKGHTPLWYAIVLDEPKIAQYLREHGAKEPDMPCGPGCLQCCFGYTYKNM